MRANTVVVLFAAAFVLPGCAARNEPALTHIEERPFHTEGRIQFQSSTTKHLLQVTRVDARRAIGDLLELIVSIRNLTKKDLWVDTRVAFIDKNGHLLKETNWMPIHLDPRTVSEHRWTSFSDRAQDYQIIFKKPGESSRELP